MRERIRIVAAVARDPGLARIQLACFGFNMTEHATWIAILVYGYALEGAATAGIVAMIQLLPAALVALVPRSRRSRRSRATHSAGTACCSPVTSSRRRQPSNPASIVMLASRIMTQLRRTTVSAPQDALRTLEAEAQRRRVPLATLLREAVEDKAMEIRTRRRPRVGVARSTDSRSAAEVTAEPVAEEPR